MVQVAVRCPGEISAFDDDVRLHGPSSGETHGSPAVRGQLAAGSQRGPAGTARIGAQVVQVGVGADGQCVPGLRRVLDGLQVAAIKVVALPAPDVARRDDDEPGRRVVPVVEVDETPG
jgi:hypothetical protein